MTQNLYDVPMKSLNFYNHNGSCPTRDGIDSFEYGGQTFKCDDLVVVDGQIGNIEIVNVEAGVCGLGMSFIYDDMMARKHWTMSSGHRCKLDGIRHATDEEKAIYDIDANDVGDVCDEADRKWKERFERLW